MATSAPSWASPQTSGQVRRSQALADTIREMQQGRTPDSYRTASATNYNILADAILGYAGANAEKKANEALTADRTRIGDMIRGSFPDQRGIEAQQLNADQAFDLTPGANDQRKQQGGIGNLASMIFETTGDPAAALNAGLSQQRQAIEDERYGRQEAREDKKLAFEMGKPVIAGAGDRGFVDIDGDGKLDEVFNVPGLPGADKAPQLKEGGNGNWWEYDPNTREFKDTGIAAPKPSAGVTINMPGNVREGVDPLTGRPVFVGIDPKNPDAGFQTIAGAAPPSNMMGAETRSKFMALAPNAYAGIEKLKELFADDVKEDPLEGAGVAAAIASNLPFVGDIAARGLGGQKWQDFDQAWNAIELGVHIPAGAAVSVSEAQRFLKANQPALNETRETKKRKIANVERFYQGLEAGFRGDWSGLQRLMSDSQSTPTNPAGVSQLDAEERAMVEELRKLGKTPAEINAILAGN